MDAHAVDGEDGGAGTLVEDGQCEGALQQRTEGRGLLLHAILRAQDGGHATRRGLPCQCLVRKGRVAPQRHQQALVLPHIAGPRDDHGSAPARCLVQRAAVEAGQRRCHAGGQGTVLVPGRMADPSTDTAHRAPPEVLAPAALHGCRDRTSNEN
jgi:hypothetical protein